jgi:hypothetical protein
MDKAVDTEIIVLVQFLTSLTVSHDGQNTLNPKTAIDSTELIAIQILKSNYQG